MPHRQLPRGSELDWIERAHKFREAEPRSTVSTIRLASSFSFRVRPGRRLAPLYRSPRHSPPANSTPRGRGRTVELQHAVVGAHRLPARERQARMPIYVFRRLAQSFEEREDRSEAANEAMKTTSRRRSGRRGGAPKLSPTPCAVVTSYQLITLLVAVISIAIPAYRAGAAELGLKGGPLRPVLSYSPRELSFDRRHSQGQSVTLLNKSSAPIAITGVTVKGARFILESDTCGSVLAGDSSCTLEVAFNGAVPATDVSGGGQSALRKGTLTISDDAAGSPHRLRLLGRLWPATSSGDAGSVLIAGGADDSGSAIATAELYDSASGTFAATGGMVAPRAGQTTTLLGNGGVLMVGAAGTCTTTAPELLLCGPSLSGCVITCEDTTELYDPMAATFQPTGNTNLVLISQTATRLANGQVLVAGGQGWFCLANSPYGACEGYLNLAKAELYDPSSGTFTPTGKMIHRRSGHEAALLQSGAVLVVGSSPDDSKSAESLRSFDWYFRAHRQPDCRQGRERGFIQRNDSQRWPGTRCWWPRKQRRSI